MLLLHIEDGDGEHHGRKVALHLGDVVHTQEVDVIERRCSPEGEGVAPQLLDALLIRLALLDGFHLEVFLLRKEVFVVEEQFAIVLMDDVVVHEPLYRLLVHTGHGEDAEGTLAGLTGLGDEPDFLALLGRYHHHAMPRFLGTAQKFVVVYHAVGILRKLALKFARGLALVRAVVYHDVAFLLLLLHPVFAL